MILGIGCDLCQVDRIRRSLKRFGNAWIDELFTLDERTICQNGQDPALLFARDFCSKEACSKALGTGINEDIGWRDMEVSQIGTNASLRLFDGALARLSSLTPVSCRAVLHITCAGDHQMAQALVVISAAPSSR
jgi:holo-[acyl-carrier protein] synthase